MLDYTSELIDIKNDYNNLLNEFAKNDFDLCGFYVRRAVEGIITLYINLFLPGDNSDKSLTKINDLKSSKVISSNSASHLHKLRKVGNKAAHREKLHKKDIGPIIPLLKIEIDSLVRKVSNKFPQNSSEGYKNVIDVIDNERPAELNVQTISEFSVEEVNPYVDVEQVDQQNVQVRKCLAKIDEAKRHILFGKHYFVYADFEGQKKYLSFDKECVEEAKILCAQIGKNYKQIAFTGHEIPCILTYNGRLFAYIGNKEWINVCVDGQPLNNISKIYGICGDDNFYCITNKGYVYHLSSYAYSSNWIDKGIKNDKPVKDLVASKNILIKYYKDGVEVINTGYLSSMVLNKIKRIIAQEIKVVQIEETSVGEVYILLENGKLFYCGTDDDPLTDFFANEVQKYQFAKVIISNDVKTHSAFLKVDGTVITKNKLLEFDPLYDGRCLKVDDWTDIIDIYIIENNTFGITADGHLRVAGTLSKYDNSYIVPHLDNAKEYEAKYRIKVAQEQKIAEQRKIEEKKRMLEEKQRMLEEQERLMLREEQKQCTSMLTKAFLLAAANIVVVALFYFVFSVSPVLSLLAVIGLGGIAIPAGIGLSINSIGLSVRTIQYTNIVKYKVLSIIAIIVAILSIAAVGGFIIYNFAYFVIEGRKMISYF